MRNLDERIVGAELPPPQEVRRGRVFMRVYGVLVGLAALGFVLLAVLVHQPAITQLDVAITLAVQHVRLPLYGWVLTQASDLGYRPGDIITYAAVLVVLLALRLRLEAVLGVASSLLAGAVGGAIKLLVARMRPSGQEVHVAAHLTDYSFPSGHVIEYTTLFGFAFYVVLVVWRQGWARNLVLAALALLVALVGPSRVYLGEHFPSDVLGAYLLAGLWLAATIELHLVLKRRLPEWWSNRPGRGRRASSPDLGGQATGEDPPV